MNVAVFAVISGGGTAGHVVPGLAVADALVARGHDPMSIHYVGSERGVELTVTVKLHAAVNPPASVAV